MSKSINQLEEMVQNVGGASYNGLVEDRTMEFGLGAAQHIAEARKDKIKCCCGTYVAKDCKKCTKCGCNPQDDKHDK